MVSEQVGRRDINFLFSLLGPNVIVTVEPPEISGIASDVAINLTCTATLMENAATYQYQLVWFFNQFPVNDESDSRIMVWTYYLCTCDCMCVSVCPWDYKLLLI